MRIFIPKNIKKNLQIMLYTYDVFFKFFVALYDLKSLLVLYLDYYQLLLDTFHTNNQLNCTPNVIQYNFKTIVNRRIFMISG